MALAGCLRGAQAPDSADCEKHDEETKFTADRLSAIASEGKQGFLDRFAGKILDIRGAVASRNLTDGAATVQIGKATGSTRYGMVCRATDHASLQAAAVLAENQEIRVSGSVTFDASSPDTILVSPCTILTNNIQISPTAELAEPYAKSEAKSGPPQGRYRCGDEDTNTFSGWLSILPGNRYREPAGESGRYRYDEKLNRVFSRNGALDGWQAEFRISSKGRILTLIAPEGRQRHCRWQGGQ